MREQLRALIEQLRLHGMADALDAELARAEREAIAAPELLYRLLSQEAASRRERSLAYRLAQARLPWQWSLDSFPFDRQPGVSKAQIQTLAGLDFLRRADNVLLIGKPGTGKTGIGIGLLREACLNGYRGRFYNAQVLLDELYASLADRTTTRLLGQLSRMQPLLIDELAGLWRFLLGVGHACMGIGPGLLTFESDAFHCFCSHGGAIDADRKARVTGKIVALETL